jgi:hypothetical protein
MSRLTKQIQLVLISSSLAMYGCQHEPDDEASCRQQQPRGGMPPVCGPVDGRRTSHGAGYHGYSHSFWGGSGRSGSSGSRSSIGGSSRGGFGSSFHGGGS